MADDSKPAAAQSQSQSASAAAPSAAFTIPSNDILRAILDEDEKLLSDASSTDFWKPHKQRKTESFVDRCFVHKASGDAIWSLLVIGDVYGPKTDSAAGPIRISDGVDLLDRSLAERQKEWHELLLPGGGILESWSTGIDRFAPDGDVQLCYFAYRAPVILVSTRDCLYLKIRRSYENGSVLISYRTVDLLPGVAANFTHDKAPFNKKYVRISFAAGHKVDLLPADVAAEGFRYQYYQHADSKGMIPKSLANGPQADVMLKEIEGVRKAVKNGKNLRLDKISNLSTGATEAAPSATSSAAADATVST